MLRSYFSCTRDNLAPRASRFSSLLPFSSFSFQLPQLCKKILCSNDEWLCSAKPFSHFSLWFRVSLCKSNSIHQKSLVDHVLHTLLTYPIFQLLKFHELQHVQHCSELYDSKIVKYIFNIFGFQLWSQWRSTYRAEVLHILYNTSCAFFQSHQIIKAMLWNSWSCCHKKPQKSYFQRGTWIQHYWKNKPSRINCSREFLIIRNIQIFKYVVYNYFNEIVH